MSLPVPIAFAPPGVSPEAESPAGSIGPQSGLVRKFSSTLATPSLLVSEFALFFAGYYQRSSSICCSSLSIVSFARCGDYLATCSPLDLQKWKSAENVLQNLVLVCVLAGRRYRSRSFLAPMPPPARHRVASCSMSLGSARACGCRAAFLGSAAWMIGRSCPVLPMLLLPARNRTPAYSRRRGSGSLCLVPD